MNKDKNIKWVATKIAPSVKEVDYWIDLSADSKGSVIKYHNGKDWVPMNQTLSINEIKKMISAAFDKLDMTKVNKVEGKQLSTNDYTNEDKTKLNNLIEAVATLTNKINEIEQLLIA